MKFFRLHIARLYGFLLVLTGIGLSYAQPVQQKENYSAFTSWLESHLRSNDQDVEQQLEAIATGESELDAVIRKASALVKNHSEDFNLPVSGEENPTEDDVYQVLIDQWNNYRNAESGMGSAVRVEPLKTHIIPPIDGLYFSSTPANKHELPTVPTHKTHAFTSGTLAPSYILSPFESGTAIGAP